MKKNSIIVFVLFLVFSCSSEEANKIENIYWVNSTKVDCVGVGPMTCLQIQKNESIIQDKWELFYSSIEGFKYEPGFIYKLNVKEEQLENVPADAYSVKYTLVEILEKNNVN